MNIIDITPIVNAVIALLAAIVSSVVIPWIHAKIDDAETGQFLRWVEIAVAAAEQLYHTADGEAKKRYVLDYLEKKGYALDARDVNNAIEAAVLRLHNELYGQTILHNGDYRITQPYEVHTALLNMGGNNDGQQP